MAREGAIEVEGVVVEVLSGKMYRVELTNGHRLLGFARGKVCSDLAGLGPGDRVRLEMSPCDLSVGRIVKQAQRDKI